jgi:hypothetical protein
MQKFKLSNAYENKNSRKLPYHQREIELGWTYCTQSTNPKTGRRKRRTSKEEFEVPRERVLEADLGEDEEEQSTAKPKSHGRSEAGRLAIGTRGGRSEGRGWRL